MKTKLKLFALIVALLCTAILLMPNQVLATEVKEVANLTELQAALADETVSEIKLSTTITIDGDVTINGNGKTITAAFKKAFVVTGGKVNFNNVNIVNTAGAGRCIDVRDGDVDLTLAGVTLKATSTTAYNQTLNVGGDFTGPAKINIKDSEIFAEHPGYAIITFNPVELTIDNSEIAGYAAIEMREAYDSKGSAGSIVNINKSTLTGINNCDDPDNNSFGTIVFLDHDIEVNINDSTLVATGEGEAAQVIIGENRRLGDSDKPNKVTISGNTVITAQEAIASMQNKNATVTLNKGVTSNIEIPAKLLPSGMMAKNVNGTYVVSEIEVDFVVSQDKEENNEDFALGAVQTETTKETLNSSLKANADAYQKAEEAIKNGEDVNVEIKVEELNAETIKEEEKQKIEETVLENETIHQYFDISVLVTANNAEIGRLTELTDKVKLSMKLPKDLIQEGRKFFILKLHGDKVEKIEAVVNGENLEFETNEFSLYALAYEDVPAEEKDDTPKMGTINMPSYVWVALASIALIGIVTTKKNSKHSK